jgi:hypothetical protein
MVPATPKNDATTAADTEARVLAHTWVPVTSSRAAAGRLGWGVGQLGLDV